MIFVPKNTKIADEYIFKNQKILNNISELVMEQLISRCGNICTDCPWSIFVRKKITKEDWTPIKIHNYSIKAMMNRFLVELWEASFLVEGKTPPANLYILNDPKHNRHPMLVPVTEKMVRDAQLNGQ